MGVELGIAGPAGSMPEGCTDEAVGLDELATPGSSSGVTRLGGQVVEHGANRPVVSSRRSRPGHGRVRMPRGARSFRG